MIGIPPLSGFASKLYFATAALETRYASLAVLVAVVIGTVLSAMYYIPVMFRILSKRKDPPDQKTTESVQAYFSAKAPPLFYRITLVIFMMLILCLGLFSQQILRLIEQGLAVLG